MIAKLIADKIKTSEFYSRTAHDLLEQAPDGPMNRAAVELLEAVAFLRSAVREQQKQIETLQERLAFAALPTGD